MGLYRNAMSFYKKAVKCRNAKLLVQMKRFQMRFCLLIVSPEISCSFLASEVQGCVSVCVLQKERTFLSIYMHIIIRLQLIIRVEK